MHVFVTSSDGKRTIYESDRFGTVRDLKLKIGRSLGVPMTYARLMYNGHLLPNNGILEDLGIKRLANLDLIFRPIVFTPKQLNEKDGERKTSAVGAARTCLTNKHGRKVHNKNHNINSNSNKSRQVVAKCDESDSEILDDELSGDL